MEAEWYLNVEGSKSGPYSSEQIEGLLDDGEILPSHLISPSQEGEKWTPVGSIVEKWKQKTSPATEESEDLPFNPDFEPPERPENLDERTESPEEVQAKPHHPSRELLGLLETAKDRSSARLNPPEVGTQGFEFSLESLTKLASQKRGLFIAVAIGVVLLLLS